MKGDSFPGTGPPGGNVFLKRCCFLILLFEVLLGIAHLLWPEYRWGQGRRSYFHLAGSQTLASWLAGVQLLAVAGMSLAGFHRDRQRQGDAAASGILNASAWVGAALICLGLSFLEITRIHHRFNFLGYPDPNAFEHMVVFFLCSVLLLLCGWFLWQKTGSVRGYRRFAMGWLALWVIHIAAASFSGAVPAGWRTWFALLTGLTYLLGCTLLLLTVGGCVMRPGETRAVVPVDRGQEDTLFARESDRLWILLGAGGAAFTMIFLEVILFQLMTIFSSYLNANAIISIALLGGAAGGLIGYFTAHRAPLHTIIAMGLALPVSILLVLAVSVMLSHNTLITSLLLMVPFICIGAIVAIVLARIDPHVAYFAVLIGSGIGALLVNASLSLLREEGSMFFLAAFAFLTVGCFAAVHRNRRAKHWLMLLAATGVAGFVVIGLVNMGTDRINVVRTKLESSFPSADLLYSRSSFVGRYDIVRMQETDLFLKAFENGRVSDTIHPLSEEHYQIDPRLPSGLIEDPSVLVLGLAGDGITKTAKFMADKVYGVEINPVIVSLQSNELARLNGRSYEGIDVTVMDARSYVEQSRDRYDMITLLNTHFSRGTAKGRQPGPEYLYTVEALNGYLDHLTQRGLVVVEEPINGPWREPPVWKLLFSMQKVLKDRGIEEPGRHFFIFQWSTRRNNYIQILMKKTPFSQGEVARLERWLADVDRIPRIEKERGKRLGPIRTATTTVLHSPGDAFATNVSGIVNGRMGGDFLRAHNILPITDDRPFMFDVDPKHPVLKGAYAKVLCLVLLLLPVLFWLMARSRTKLRDAMPHMLAVALAGVGFMLVEIVLMQRYELFLGSPVVTFSSVLGSLLLFSGLGSLWSRRMGKKGVYAALALILLLLLMHQYLVPLLFPLVAGIPLFAKAALTVLTMAPVAFLMGVPFPYVLRSGKSLFSENVAATLYASNAATSALAVPLAFNVSTGWGLTGTYLTGVFIYGLIGLLLAGIHAARIRTAANLSAGMAMVLLLFSPWLLSPSEGGSKSGPGPAALSRVYALSYGESSYTQAEVFQGGSQKRKVPFAWMFWAIVSEDRTVLVDTGFHDEALARKWRIRQYRNPTDRLRQLGIDPEDVSDVIMTHAHWDHVGLVGAYKNARIWMQEKEYNHAVSQLGDARAQKKGMRRQDLAALQGAAEQGRLRLVKGETVLAPGITMVPSGGHTPGSQFVAVETLQGSVVIAGDNTYLYRNSRSHIPIGSAYDLEENLAAIKKMHRSAASLFYIIPGHDPLVMAYFPEKSDAIVEITTLSR